MVATQEQTHKMLYGTGGGGRPGGVGKGGGGGGGGEETLYQLVYIYRGIHE